MQNQTKREITFDTQLKTALNVGAYLRKLYGSFANWQNTCPLLDNNKEI